MRAIKLNKNITVFGLGKSGLAAAQKLVSLGAKVFASDQNQVAVELPGVELELGGHTEKSIQAADLIIVSPGVRLDIPILKKAKQKGIPIISEIELAFSLLKKPIIAVTGTNGKTTTTTLIGELLKAGGKKVVVAGNIGLPLIAVDDTNLDYIVAEISSYQLETIDKFKPWISIILNIQPDHLERHGSMAEYIKQKARIFMNQTSDDYVIFNEDDTIVKRMVKNARARVIGFSKNHPEIITIAPDQIKIPGRHNLENCLAAVQAAYLCGVAKKTAAEALKTFPGVPHRIELVKNIDNVDYYNDSKATNPDSTLVAIDTFKGRGIVLILGGKDKGVSLDNLSKKIKARVKAVILLGQASARFSSALKKADFNSIYQTGSIKEAVSKSASLAKAGDVVLLSPACSSFDMFTNFEERGRVFKECVWRLNEQGKA